MCIAIRGMLDFVEYGSPAELEEDEPKEVEGWAR